MKRLSLYILAICFVILSMPITSGCNSENITTYNINSTYNEDDKTLTGIVELEYYNNTNTALNSLHFNLFGNAFRSDAKYFPASKSDLNVAISKGLTYGYMQIESVKSNNKLLEHSVGGVDNTLLVVNLEKEVFPNEKYELQIEYSLKLAKIDLRLGYTDKGVNLGNFYPILCVYEEGVGFIECPYYNIGDPFYSDVANYKVSLKVDSNYVVASSGELEKVNESGGYKTYNYTLNGARDFAFVISKNFSVITETVGGVSVNYYYYADADPYSSLAYATKAITTYQNLFGKYLYSSLAVVQTPFFEGGMEYPALVYISDSISGASYGEVIVHEIAHQWWYAGVGNNQIAYGFLDEGLTEYSVVLFYENNSEYNLDRPTLMTDAMRTYQTYYNVYNTIFNDVDTSMLRSLNEYKSEYEYVCIAYIKGCLFFDNLRESVGEEKFANGLKTYYKKYAKKIATPNDLTAIFMNLGVLKI